MKNPIDSSNARQQVRSCHIAADPLENWLPLPNSNYDHRGIKIASSNTEILAVGSIWPNHSKTESLTGAQWSVEKDYPFYVDISESAVVSKNQDFYVFGGWSDYKGKATIAKFNAATRQWSQVGTMKSPRHGHSVISIGNSFMIVGGIGQTHIEECVGEETVDCQNTDLTLKNYEYYPALFTVNTNFCVAR